MSYKIIFLLVLFTPFHKAYSQVKAVTEKGDTIFVYDNGTWSFDEEEIAPTIEGLDYLDAEIKIDTLEGSRIFDPECDKEIESELGILKFKYNSKKYKRVPPATLNPEAEFAFQSKSNDSWCLIITEPTEIPADKLFKIAKHTMEMRTGSEAEIVLAELIKVNDVDVFRGVLSCSISGIDLVFDSYYYADDRGSVQAISYCSKNAWQADNKLLLNLINGLQIQKEK